MRILLLLCTLYGIARVVEGSFGRSGASIIAKLNVGVKKDQRIPARTRARGPVSVQAAGAAGSKATQAGLSGALAGLLQVVLLMWLRTMINYQYRYGGSMRDTVHALYADGGIARFYKGFSFAVVQGPLSKFGSVAANEYSLVACKLLFPGALAVATFLGSLLAAVWRLGLMPIDTCKTVAQVGGSPALKDLLDRVLVRREFSRLYRGGTAVMLATAVAHYPWFLTYNALQRLVTVPDGPLRRVARDAAVGFIASTVSDVSANPVRVLKTMKQSYGLDSAETLTYKGALKLVADGEGGIVSLFHRGLLARITTNGVQSMIFTVLMGLQRKRSKALPTEHGTVAREEGDGEMGRDGGRTPCLRTVRQSEPEPEPEVPV